MAETPLLKIKIKELQGQVAQYSQGKNYVPFSFHGLLSSGKAYLAIPIAVFLLLIISRPGFLYVKEINVEKFSLSRFFLFWIIFSAILVVSLFAYNYKKN